MEIIRGLEILPEAIDLAARELAPHKIVTWVRDFANSVTAFIMIVMSSVTVSVKN